MPLVKIGETLPAGYRDAVRMATRVKSSLITSSRAALREAGHFDRYVALLDRETRATFDDLVAGVWVPVSLIRAHYLACDRLGLSVPQQIELGRGLSNRMHKPIFSVGIRLAGAVGVTPWTLAEQATRVWSRSYDGGDLVIVQLGPKEGRVEVLGFPMGDIGYCRVAWRGIILGGTELFSTRAYVHEVATMCTRDRLAYRVSWA